MIEFVNLMEGRSLAIDDPKIETYWYSDQWIMEPIRFGIRYQLLIDSQNSINFLGKRKEYKRQNQVNSLSRVVESIKICDLPKETLLEGYLTFSNDRSKAYSFLNLESFDENVFSDAVFYLTDLIYCNSKPFFNLPLFDRLSKLKDLIRENDKLQLQEYFTKQKKQKFDELSGEFKIFLFKNFESVYSFKVSSSWRILKTPESFFMVILGFVESDHPNYKGMVMALEAGQFRENQLVRIMNVPVHANDDRVYFFKHKNQLVNSVFEILALSKTTDGKYEDARFLRMRPDITIQSCVF